LALVNGALKYRGKIISESDIRFIQDVIEADPKITRRGLSRRICLAWGWVQANGALRDMVCRSLLLTLHREGRIRLPPPRIAGAKGLIRCAPETMLIDETPVTGSLQELGGLEFRQVRRTAEEPLFNSLIAQHHYLGHTQPVGEHLKFLVSAGGRPIACLAWSSAPRHLGPRDRFIGWSAEARRRNIRFIAYNLRFIVLPWVRIPCLASHILGRMAALVPQDWVRIYRHPIYYLETFVDPARFSGTCYRAANWIALGLTTGRGHNATTHKKTQPVKQVLGYPLVKDFRRRLSEISA
jgi:hypothetical protein